MARPKVNEQEKRIIQVNIRLTVDEGKRLNEYAASSGMTPANWIRQTVFTGKIPPTRLSQLDAAIYYELKKIGVNVNQVTHKINQGEIPQDYSKLQLELVMLLEKILKQLFHDRKHD